MKRYWTWPIAIYLFLGGLGGAILFLAMCLYFMAFPIELFIAPIIVSLLALGVGCFFLVFELGQPTVFYRVFLRPTAIIMWGATLLSIALIASFLLLISYWEPFAMLAGARVPLLVVSGISGAAIMVYTGVLLASLKAHPFWSTPALPILFFVSALSTGCAAHSLSVGKLLESNPELVERALGIFHSVDTGLIVFELMIVGIYLGLLIGAGNVVAKKAALKWVKGDFSLAFWLGLVACGLVIPLVFYLMGSEALGVLAAVLVLIGGLILRFLVVWTNDMMLIKGQQKYHDRLPKGDEKFLQIYKEHAEPRYE
ncbi:MAG: polysulfide reductase NrfD [Coriobacteriia bacterium]|nr:polysulfide reductase NrfD [Coriobacteriia bacterium]